MTSNQDKEWQEIRRAFAFARLARAARVGRADLRGLRVLWAGEEVWHVERVLSDGREIKMDIRHEGGRLERLTVQFEGDVA